MKIEDAFNTSYIISVIISLLYVPGNLYNKIILQKKLDKTVSEFQVIVNDKVIEHMKTGKMITSDTVNRLRILSYSMGWKGLNSAILFELHNVLDYYCFINDKLLHNYISMNSKQMSYISIIPTIDNKLISYYTNSIGIIGNIPLLIPIYVNRFVSTIKTEIQVDIPRKIKFKDHTMDLYWYIYSIICHTGGPLLKSGYYVTFIKNNKDWYIIDHTQDDSYHLVNINNYIEFIKKNAVLVFYKYNEYIY